MEDIVPTPPQDELFKLTVRNFVKNASSHRQVLADSYLSLVPADIDKWLKGNDLPNLPRRVYVMDFIWNHYCNCRCD